MKENWSVIYKKTILCEYMSKEEAEWTVQISLCQKKLLVLNSQYNINFTGSFILKHTFYTVSLLSIK